MAEEKTIRFEVFHKGGASVVQRISGGGKVGSSNITQKNLSDLQKRAAKSQLDVNKQAKRMYDRAPPDALAGVSMISGRIGRALIQAYRGFRFGEQQAAKGGGGLSSAISAGLVAGLTAAGALALFVAIAEILKQGFSITMKMFGQVIKVLSLILKPIDIVIGQMLAFFLKLAIPLVRIMMLFFAIFQKAYASQLQKIVEQKKASGEPITELDKLTALSGSLNIFIGSMFIDLFNGINTVFLDTIGALTTTLSTILAGLMVAVNIFSPEEAANAVANVKAIFEGMKLGSMTSAENSKKALEAVITNRSLMQTETSGMFDTFDGFLISIANIFNKKFGTELKQDLALLGVAVDLAKGKLSTDDGSLKKALEDLGNKAPLTKTQLDSFKSSLIILGTYAESVGVSSQLEYMDAIKDVSNEAITSANKMRNAFGIAGGTIGRSSGGIIGSILGDVAGRLFAQYILGEKQSGGFIGETGPYLLHAGEKVIPSHSVSEQGSNITNNITINAQVSDDMDIRQLADRLAEYMQNDMSRRGSYARY